MMTPRKILGFDPGAERMGVACVSLNPKTKCPVDEGSAIFRVPRVRNESKEPFQEYRLRLIEFWIETAPNLLREYNPDVVVGEIVPVVGGGNFVVATQSELARTAITVVYVVAFQMGLPVRQVGATTVKKAIGGSGKATKVAVRNGVLNLLPETDQYREEWKKTFDRSDAYAVALTSMGCKNGR